MSEQVNIEQVREAFCLLSNTEQRDTVLEMCNELEVLRAVALRLVEYCDTCEGEYGHPMLAQTYRMAKDALGGNDGNE